MKKKLQDGQLPGKREGSVKVNHTSKLTKLIILREFQLLVDEIGFKATELTTVAANAGITPRTIYNHFGSKNGLLKALLCEPEYGYKTNEEINAILLLDINQQDDGKALLIIIFQNCFRTLLSSPILQEVSLMKLTVNNPLIDGVAIEREKMRQAFFELPIKHFKDTNVDFNSIVGMITGSMNFVVLQNKKSDIEFCGIDLNKQSHQLNLISTIEQVIEWTYSNAKRK